MFMQVLCFVDDLGWHLAIRCFSASSAALISLCEISLRIVRSEVSKSLSLFIVSLQLGLGVTPLLACA